VKVCSDCTSLYCVSITYVLSHMACVHPKHPMCFNFNYMLMVWATISHKTFPWAITFLPRSDCPVHFADQGQLNQPCHAVLHCRPCCFCWQWSAEVFASDAYGHYAKLRKLSDTPCDPVSNRYLLCCVALSSADGHHGTQSARGYTLDNYAMQHIPLPHPGWLVQQQHAVLCYAVLCSAAAGCFCGLQSARGNLPG
jgi:hypothetical protein